MIVYYEVKDSGIGDAILMEICNRDGVSISDCCESQISECHKITDNLSDVISGGEYVALKIDTEKNTVEILTQKEYKEICRKLYEEEQAAEAAKKAAGEPVE